MANSLREARQHQRKSFDILIADVRLPDGNGLDLLREMGGKTRGIAMSGDDDVDCSIEAGFEVHLVKPVPIEKLLEAIRGI